MGKETQQTKTEKIVFAIIGSGWRAGFYLRIAKEMPERFEVCGLVTRSEEKGKKIESEWGVKTFRNIDDLLKATTPSFILISVNKEIAPLVIEDTVLRGIPVLLETPPAPDVDGLIKLNQLVKNGAKIQVAEQYHLQPLHFARIALAKSGRLGEISQVQVSFSHTYHAMSIIRKLLSIGFENAKISAFQFDTRFVAGPGRDGLPEHETMANVKQDIALLDFDGKVAIYDFAANQHRSYVRSQRILVRGDRGEISNEEVRCLENFRKPVKFNLELKNAGLNGNLEGYYIQGVFAGERWIYLNPFIPARLSDEEIAIASCLTKMDGYVKGGPSFYSLAQASQDQYLNLMIDKAIKTGEKVVTQTQPWAE